MRSDLPGAGIGKHDSTYILRAIAGRDLEAQQIERPPGIEVADCRSDDESRDHVGSPVLVRNDSQSTRRDGSANPERTRRELRSPPGAPSLSLDRVGARETGPGCGQHLADDAVGQLDLPRCVLRLVGLAVHLLAAHESGGR